MLHLAPCQILYSSIQFIVLVVIRLRMGKRAVNNCALFYIMYIVWCIYIFLSRDLPLHIVWICICSCAQLNTDCYAHFIRDSYIRDKKTEIGSVYFRFESNVNKWNGQRSHPHPIPLAQFFHFCFFFIYVHQNIYYTWKIIHLFSLLILR